MGWMHSQDVALLNWIHTHLVPGSVPVLQVVSDIATYVSIAMILAVLVAAWIKRDQSLLLRAVTLVIVLLVVIASTRGLKAAFDRDRPFTTYPEIEKLSSGGDSSFPSGHTLEALAMATAITVLFRKRKLAIPVFCWAFLVAYSRIALGVHYPSDVLAGILAGMLIGWGIPRIIRGIVHAPF